MSLAEIKTHLSILKAKRNRAVETLDAIIRSVEECVAAMEAEAPRAAEPEPQPPPRSRRVEPEGE